MISFSTPAWKNRLLIGLLLFACVYALPNAFPEQPVLQITPVAAHASVQEHTASSDVNNLDITLQQVLEQIPFQIIEQIPHSNILQIRFFDVKTQLAARNRLQATIGKNYTITPQLIPTTPRWLQWLGAHPMKLGLDLRGGVHFTLAIDTQGLQREHLKGLLKGMEDQLQHDQYGFRQITQYADSGEISFKDSVDLRTAFNKLAPLFPELQLIQEPSEAPTLRIQFSPQGLRQLTQHALEQTIATLHNRINELGISEPTIQTQGEDRIIVELPGVQDITRAQQILGSTATLEFRFVDTQASTVENIKEASSPSYYTYRNTAIKLKEPVILTGKAITAATQSADTLGKPTVNIRLSGLDAARFHQVTREHKNHWLAILYVETKLDPLINSVLCPSSSLNNDCDAHVPQVRSASRPLLGLKLNHNTSFSKDLHEQGKARSKSDSEDTQSPSPTFRKTERIISVARVMEALGRHFQISGLEESEAADLALLLRSGALPAPIYILEQSTIGPQLGSDNIKLGQRAIFGGFLFAVCFMALYYGRFGWIANITLLINLVLLIAVLSLLEMTLTLPGMAGILLTVAIAVDAEVLIFERIREELRHGASTKASIAIGYKRAWTAILDANLSTLIIAFALFFTGANAIKGFALTLALGTLTSLLSAMSFSRALVHHFYGRHKLKTLAIGV